jgi:hypothetical protein
VRYLLPILGYAACGGAGCWLGAGTGFQDFAIAGGLIAGLVCAAVLGHFVGRESDGRSA